MKAKLLIVFALLSLSTACTTTVRSSCAADDVCSQTYTTSCNTDSYGSCSCTDPECRRGQPCLDSQRCCRVFGNVGGYHAS